MDPNNIVGFLPKLGGALPLQLIAGNSPLSADSRSKENKSTPVTQKEISILLLKFHIMGNAEGETGTLQNKINN